MKDVTSYRRSLPSLNALLTFEAAARQGGFTRAAQELGVTQAAVSRQVQALEHEFGVLLFRRSHRKVELTAAGTLLAGTLNACFEQIRDTADLIRQPVQADALTVGATVAFSHFWLLPRIAAFRSLCPDIAIRIVTQDSPFDLAVDDVDVIVRFGTGAPRGGDVLASLPDTVYPVAAPSLAGTLSGIDTLAGLAEGPLIASDTPDATWISWSDWFEAATGAAVAVSPTLRFSSYTDCIQAAVAGQGVGLGWDFLVRPLVEDGRLVRVGTGSVIPAGRYQLVATTKRPQQAPARRFVDWVRHALTA